VASDRESAKTKGGNRERSRGAKAKAHARTLKSGLFASGPWCWILGSITCVEPALLNGQLGIYEVAVELIPLPING
jgi:hypothetical protein